jgi:signal recognition particle subunit SEC65
MTVEEKKKELQNILVLADENLTNVLMEAAVEYQKKEQEEFVIPKEWIEEAKNVSAAIRKGEMKTYTFEETIEKTKQLFKEKYNVDYTPNI